MLKAGLVVAFFILVGRVSGFAREWLIAVRGGADTTTDIAVVLLTFPDLAVNLLLGGGLGAALIPAFKKSLPAQRSALLLQASLCAMLFLSLAALLMTLAAAPLLAVLAPGIEPQALAAYLPEFRLIAWSTPLVALSGILVAYLNSQDRFALGAAGTLIFNLCIVIALLLGTAAQLTTAITVGVVLGATIRLGTQVLASSPGWTQADRSRWLVDWQLIRQFLANFSYVTVLVALPPLARAAASLEEAGGLALFNFAHKLVELPIGVALASIAVVLLPRLAGDFAANGRESTRASLAAGLRANLMIALAIGIPAAGFADNLVQLAFFGAAFTPAQFSTLGTLCALGFLSLPIQGLMGIYGSAFAAVGHARPLVLTALAMVAAMLTLSGTAQAHFGIIGVMATYIGCYALGAVLLSAVAARHFGIEVFQDAFQNFARSFALPCGIALLLVWAGRQSAADWPWGLFWCMFSCLGFVLCAGIMDPQLRGVLRRPFGKD